MRSLLAGLAPLQLLPTTTLSQAFALAVLVTALFLGAREGRVRSLKSQVDDLQEVVEIRELRAKEESKAQAARIAQLANQLSTADSDLAQARRDLAALSRVVTGEAHYVVLGELVEAKTDAVLARLDDLVERLERITPS